MTLDRQGEIEHLFRQYGKGVGSYVLARVGDPELAEEITARVFLTVVHCYDQLRGSAISWLWTIVRREIARHFRDRNHQLLGEIEWPVLQELPLDQMERQETQTRLQSALAQLTDEQQEILYLKFFLDVRNLEIASARGLTPSHVGVLIHRALKQLRALMDAPSEAANKVDHEPPSR